MLAELSESAWRPSLVHPVPSTGWGFSSSISSDEYSMITLRSACPGLGFGLGRWILSSSHSYRLPSCVLPCSLLRTSHVRDPTWHLYGIRSVTSHKLLQFYVKTLVTWLVDCETLFGISGRCLGCLSRQPRSVECTAFTFPLVNLTRVLTAVHST